MFSFLENCLLVASVTPLPTFPASLLPFWLFLPRLLCCLFSSINVTGVNQSWDPGPLHSSLIISSLGNLKCSTVLYVPKTLRYVSPAKIDHTLKWNNCSRLLNEMGKIVQIPFESQVLMKTASLLICGCITNYMPE